MKLLVYAAMLCFSASVAAFPAVNTGLAKSTVKVTAPANPVDKTVCLACHAPVKALHERGKHADLNCASCHEIKPEHAKGPTKDNRPIAKTDHATCAQCHPDQLKDMMNMKYHKEWAKKTDLKTDHYVMDSNINRKDVQRRVPRYHIGMLADIAVTRMGGRFVYKNSSDEGRPVEKLWDKVVDTRPDMGAELKVLDPALLFSFRSQKVGALSNSATCMKCKSTDTLMDWAYLGDPKAGAPLDVNSKAMPMFLTLNSGSNCTFCHDPHAAMPRITADFIMPSLIDPQYKDNEFQKRTGKELAKVEEVNLGTRGYQRKILLLDRYDSNLICGQCHLLRGTGMVLKNDKGEAFPDVIFGTLFTDGPLAYADWFEKRGFWTNIFPATGTKYAAVPNHAHVETVSISKHGLAGVGCADCHFAKQENGRLEHQFSLPLEKVANTCMRSECHGPGSNSDWKDLGEAKYQIYLLQERAHNKINIWQQAHNKVQNYLTAVKKGDIKIGDAEAKGLHRAFARSLSSTTWWSTDYSDGIHNPAMLARDVTKITDELNTALAAAQKSEAK